MFVYIYTHTHKCIYVCATVTKKKEDINLKGARWTMNAIGRRKEKGENDEIIF